MVLFALVCNVSDTGSSVSPNADTLLNERCFSFVNAAAMGSMDSEKTFPEPAAWAMYSLRKTSMELGTKGGETGAVKGRKLTGWVIVIDGCLRSSR